MSKSIESHSIQRRQLIKGLAAAGLLPASFAGKSAFAANEAPVRVLCIALQHGWGVAGKSNRSMILDGSGDFQFPDGLDPLNSIKQYATVIDGLMTLGEWGNNHDLSYADILTAGVPFGAKESSYDKHMPLSVTPSLDYLLQSASGKPSFRFSAGYRSWGVQYHPLSFGENSEILPYYTTALDAYNSIFKDLPEVESGSAVVSTGNAAEVALRNKLFSFLSDSGQSHLAGVAQEKNKIERYLSALDFVKEKNALTVGYSGSERLQKIPTSAQTSLDDLDSYLDMVKVGFANNITTSAVIGIGDIIPITSFHHDHAHGNTSVYWDTRRTYADKVTAFVNQLQQITDFDGRSLLDNTLILLTGEVGEGGHDIVSKGQILLGGGGHITTGQYIKPERINVNRDRNAILREDAGGALRPATAWATEASARTNADLLREIANIAGLDLEEFGLSAFNRGDIILTT